jgi:hypothetical protein
LFSIKSELYTSKSDYIFSKIKIFKNKKYVYSKNKKVNFLTKIKNEKQLELLQNKLIKTLVLHDSFNEKIENIPKKLETLIFGIESKFDNSIDSLSNAKKLKTKILKLGSDFNQPINNLPKNLKVLKLSGDYNQPINNLPKKLKTLVLGSSFNQFIDNLPTSLRKLKFMGLSCFDQSINNFLESTVNLKILILDNFKKSIDNLPENLKILRLNNQYSEIEINNPLKNLKIYVNGEIK